MKNILLVILILFSTDFWHLSAQSIDSLESAYAEQVANNMEQESAKTLMFLAIAKAQIGEIDKAKEYFEKIESVLPQDDANFTGQFYLEKGKFHYHNENNHVAAESCFFIADSLLHKEQIEPHYSELLSQRGNNLIITKKYNQGLTILYELEKIYLKNPSKYTNDLVNLYANLMATEYFLNNPEQSILMGRKGVEIAKDADELSVIGKLHINFGVILYSNYFDDEAIFNYKKAIETYTKINDVDGKYHAMGALASVYTKQGKLEDALQIYEEVLANALSANKEHKAAIIYEDMAYLYFKMGDFKKAVDFIDKQIAYCENTPNHGGMIVGYFDKANYLLDLGELDSAIVYANKAMRIEEAEKDLRRIGDIHLLLSQILEKKGDHPLALEEYKQYHALMDSVYSKSLEATIAEEKVKQNIEEAEDLRTNAELESALLASQNQLYLAVLAGLGLLLLIGGILFWKLQQTRKQLENQNTQLHNLNATKDKFFGIIAHDIRSPITALEGVGEQMTYYLKKNNTEKLNLLANQVDSTAQKLSNLLNNLLNWALLQTGMIPYHPQPIDIYEIAEENIKLYEEVAAAKEIQLKNNVPQNVLVYADESATHAVIRNLINNAIKFTDKNGKVQIGTDIQGDKIAISINDTGTGIRAEKLSELFTLQKIRRKGTSGEKGSGLGLMICKELVELNKGTIQVISEFGKGSNFIFMLPKV